MEGTEVPPLLSLNEVTHYFGGLRAVADFSLELPDSALYGLIGPNGAGKTTVFNLITGIYRPSQGTIAVRGASLLGKRPHQIVQLGVARTFQNLRIFNSLSVLDNIRVARHYTVCSNLGDSVLGTARCKREEFTVRAEAQQLLEIFGLTGRMHETAGNLPYGELRKLEIARALATHPKILLLDEPAAGMNPREVGQLMELIKMIREKYQLSILLIEHHMRVVMNICQFIKVIDFGETIAQGGPRTVANDPRVIEAYLGQETIHA
ncbi:MAG: ABC transporter ATP-binding protein [Candidatus Edwardsbacteria bacterium]|nr:ABC transporter ATP-binding protein [Candidatus Edwardsbacteria bacterium]